MGFKKIGIATCVGLIRESRIFGKILRKNGFEVCSASCKIGSMKKTETPSYISCLNVNNSLLLDDDNDDKIENVNENSINLEKDILKNVAYQDERKDIKVEL